MVSTNSHFWQSAPLRKLKHWGTKNRFWPPSCNYAKHDMVLTLYGSHKHIEPLMRLCSQDSPSGSCCIGIVGDSKHLEFSGFQRLNEVNPRFNGSKSALLCSLVYSSNAIYLTLLSWHY